MNNNPPVLKIPMTKWEKLFNIIGVTCFLIAIGYLIFQLPHMPDKIAAHFNGKGEVDRWGSKYELLILPFIGFFILMLISLMEKAPHMYNYPKRLNESNAEAFYLNSRMTANFLKNFILVMFSYILFQTIEIALGKADSLNFWFLPVMGIVIVGTIIITLYRSSKIR